MMKVTFAFAVVEYILTKTHQERLYFLRNGERRHRVSAAPRFPQGNSCASRI